MKITVGIVTSTSYGTPYTDLDVKLEPTTAERKLFKDWNVPIPLENGQTTTNLLKVCFSTHGDFFREVGVSNYRTFQPDWSYFRASSSNGWNKFMNRLVVSEDREDILRRVGEIIANKLSLLTNNVPKATITADIKKPLVFAKNIQLTDLAGKKLELRVGDKIYVATEVKVDAKANTLIKSTVDDIVTKANTTVSGFEEEFSANLTMITKQYDAKLKALNEKLKTQLPALPISYELLREGVIVSSPGNEYQLYAPLHLHYKYVATPYLLWELKQKYCREQDGYLAIAVDGKWNYRWSWIYDSKFQDNVELFHAMGDTLCLGSYKVSITCIDDILKVAKDVAKVYEIINTNSMSVVNIHTDAMSELDYTIRHAPRKKFEMPDKGRIEDRDLTHVASLKTNKQGGTIWST